MMTRVPAPTCQGLAQSLVALTSCLFRSSSMWLNHFKLIYSPKPYVHFLLDPAFLSQVTMLQESPICLMEDRLDIIVYKPIARVFALE